MRLLRAETSLHIGSGCGAPSLAATLVSSYLLNYGLASDFARYFSRCCKAPCIFSIQAVVVLLGRGRAHCDWACATTSSLHYRRRAVRGSLLIPVVYGGLTSDSRSLVLHLCFKSLSSIYYCRFFM